MNRIKSTLVILLAILLVFGGIITVYAETTLMTPSSYEPLGKGNDLIKGGGNIKLDAFTEHTPPLIGVKRDVKSNSIAPITDINVTFVSNSEISFTTFNNLKVYKVFIKAGPGGILYHFDGGTTSGAGLVSPKDSISNIVFFYAVTTPPTQGRITVKKEIYNNQVEVLTQNGSTPSFKVVVKDSDGKPVHTFENLIPGQPQTTGSLSYGVYTIEEIEIPSNYELHEISEVDSDWNEKIETSNGPLTVYLDQENVNVLVVNKVSQSTIPRLTVRKKFSGNPQSLTQEDRDREFAIQVEGPDGFEPHIFNLKIDEYDYIEIPLEGGYTVTELGMEEDLIFELDNILNGTFYHNGASDVTVVVTNKLKSTDIEIPGGGGGTEFTVFTFTPNPSISITKSVLPTQVLPGQNVVFSFTVTNTGNVPLENVVVTDPMLNIEYVYGQTFFVGGSFSFIQGYTVPVDEEAGPVSNTAMVTGDYLGTTYSSTGTAVFEVLMTVVTDPVPEGEIILDEKVPAGPVPDAGEASAIIFYGLGALISAAGFGLRKRF